MDHADIRVLVNACHISVAELPLSSVGGSSLAGAYIARSRILLTGPRTSGCPHDTGPVLIDDKAFCGDTIDMGVRVTLPRIAGKRGFLDYDIQVEGSVNDDWVDPELKYGID